jgi:hypothetical protein
MTNTEVQCKQVLEFAPYVFSIAEISYFNQKVRRIGSFVLRKISRLSWHLKSRSAFDFSAMESSSSSIISSAATQLAMMNWSF